jgi:integrase
MPRKARDDRLETRTARLKLLVRREPYWRSLQVGRAIGYRRLPGGKAGTWIARRYDAVERRTYQALGNADDLMDADGVTTLTFAQAQTKAAEWFRAVERAAGRLADPISVREAMEHYVADYIARGGKAERQMRGTIAFYVLPTLGERRVVDLSAATIRAWHHAVAAAAAQLRTSANAARPNVREAVDAEARRARRSTANRILRVLKAGLSLAYREGRVPSDDAWRRVKPFANVEVPRIRYLTDDQVVRLVNACPRGLRALAAAALLTGCRYGELARLRVGDFDADAAVLHIRQAKAGKPRAVPLTDEAKRHFLELAAGKPGSALLLVRADGSAWGESHQYRPLEQACARAGIGPAVSFHVLRHTAASRLVQRGVSLSVVAAFLGNTEVICARHYAHLSPNYVSDTIRQAAGELGIVPAETTVKPLRRIS